MSPQDRAKFDRMAAELASLRRDTRLVPVRWSPGSGSAAAESYPWVQLLVKGGQTLITTAPEVYGIKRRVGEAKPTGWIYLPRQAAARCFLGIGANAGKVTSTILDNIGAGYITDPTITVGAPPSGGTQAEITVAHVDNGGYVEGVWVTDCGSLYNVAAAVTFSAPPSGVTATGVASLRDGKVVFITITNAGSGYVTAPTVTITPAYGGGGSGATADCCLGQGKVALTITNQGAGYVTAPTITIGAPAQQPVPMPPQVADDTPADWADGVGWGTIMGGSLTGGLAANQPALICHDDRGMVPWGLSGEGGGTVAFSRPPDSILSWYKTMMRLTIADADADGVLEAWVPMAGGA